MGDFFSKLLNKISKSVSRRKPTKWNKNQIKLDILQLEERITSRIMTAHRITSAKLLGISEASGFSNNAEEIKVSYAHFEGTVIEPKRKKITQSFGYILRLAGFNIKIKVIPNRLIEDVAAGNPDDLAAPNTEIQA